MPRMKPIWLTGDALKTAVALGLEFKPGDHVRFARVTEKDRSYWEGQNELADRDYCVLKYVSDGSLLTNHSHVWCAKDYVIAWRRPEKP